MDGGCGPFSCHVLEELNGVHGNVGTLILADHAHSRLIYIGAV